MRALLLLVLVFAPACAGPSFSPRQLDLEMPFEDAWTEFERLVVQAGFRPDPQETDRGNKVIQSKWRTRALAFRRGSRKRLRGEFTKGDPGHVLLDFYVENQIVKDFARSMNPAEEDWQHAGQDLELEGRIEAQMMLFAGQTLNAPERTDPRLDRNGDS